MAGTWNPNTVMVTAALIAALCACSSDAGTGEPASTAPAAPSMQSLGVTTDAVTALEVNDEGPVIGSGLTTAGSQAFGFVWDPGSGMVDLGWAAEPVSVNAHGLVGGVLTADEAS